MTITEALDTAAVRVTISGLGRRGDRQWQVDHYSFDHRAWWQGTPTSDIRSARLQAWEWRVTIALQLLGIEEPDETAASLAQVAMDQERLPDWRSAVRSVYRKHQKQEG